MPFWQEFEFHENPCYTEDAGLPYFDRAVVTANGYW